MRQSIFDDNITNEINENKRLILNRFMVNPHLILENELETLAMFYCKVFDSNKKPSDDILQSYREKVKIYCSDKEQLAINHRRRAVDRMLKQLEWQKYCGAEKRIQRALNLVKHTRVLTLLGIGGLGKTALATEIVRIHLKRKEFEYFPFITSKSSEQGHYTFSEEINLSDPTNQIIHPGYTTTKDFDVLINTLLEIDDSRTQTQKNQLSSEEKKKIVFDLFIK